MNTKTHNSLFNCLTVIVSLIVFGLICEFVVFRFVLSAADVPRNSFVDGVVKFVPNQQGIYRIKYEISAPFSINTNGWNSAHSIYTMARDPRKSRVAIIGDSYVEALRVAYNQSLAEILEQELGPDTTEVFRFGVSGAPLSQYLHMLEREVIKYYPDIVVVVLVHNDFDESFLPKSGRYTNSFLKLRIDNGTITDEITPQPYQSTWIDRLRTTATVRYFYYRHQMNLQNLKRGLVALVTQDNSMQNDENSRYQGNVDIQAIRARQHDITAAINYIFQRIKDVADTRGIRLLFVMDAVRNVIYRGNSNKNLSRGGVLKLNRIVQDSAQRHGIPFIDLHLVFTRDFAIYGQRFEFEHDGHWNARSHRLVAKTIARYLESTR